MYAAKYFRQYKIFDGAQLLGIFITNLSVGVGKDLMFEYHNLPSIFVSPQFEDLAAIEMYLIIGYINSRIQITKR